MAPTFLQFGCSGEEDGKHHTSHSIGVKIDVEKNCKHLSRTICTTQVLPIQLLYITLGRSNLACQANYSYYDLPYSFHSPYYFCGSCQFCFFIYLFLSLLFKLRERQTGVM